MIEFRALGPAELSGPEGTDPQSVLARPKLLGLLSFLAAGAARGYHRRDALIGLFWAELDQERARSAVRQSLYRLRQFLGEDVVLTRGDDEVALSESAFRCDVVAFDDAVDGGHWESALELYRGDLLEGLYVSDAPEYERWLDARRKELHQRASDAAWQLAEREASLRHTAAAGRWARQARGLFPLDERLLRRVIKLLDGMGDRSGAVREYETFARRMAEQLELEPSPETQALIDQVRSRAVVADEPEPLRPIAPGSEKGLAHALAERYTIKRTIGSGGMATVYLARDLRHDRDVAVKVMHSDVAATMGTERFLREIKIAAQLTHPHIVPLYDSGLAEGFLYYVMPYVEGESLRDRLARDGQLPIDEALAIAREVADALGHAHSVGVVHRDIKPENVLLSGGHALVADFGIARAVTAASETRLTQSGMVVGTPPYMSPEQGAGTTEVDGRSDVYSLACVLYEMLAGQPPFTGPTAESIARQHLTTQPRPITEIRPTVPDGVSAAILRALAKTPADRFSVASKFVEALASPSVTGETRRSRRSRLRVALLVAIPIAVVILVISLISRDSRPDLDPYRVAVVSLENRTGDTALALLGSLAADWITQGLQEIEVIDVVPRGTGAEPGPSFASGAGSTTVSDARAAGEATGAGTVVAGAYYRRGDSLEFQTQVIDAGGERLLRAVPPVTGPLGASGTVLDSLRRRVIATVAAALDRRLLISTAVSPLPSLEAYRLYLEGYRTFYSVPERMREALQYFYRAVALDSTFTDPRFFIVFAHQNLGEWSASDSNAQLLVPFRSGFSDYQRATLDWIQAVLRGDRATALRAARNRRVRYDLAVEAFRFNRPYETIALMEGIGDQSAAGFNYFKWITLMEAYHLVGEHRHELAEAQRARALGPDRMRMLISEVRALAALGRLDDVEQRLDESLLLPREGIVVAVDAMIIAGGELRAHGYRDASLGVADRALQWFVDRPPAEQTTARYKYGLAQTFYLAERWEEARALFEELASSNGRDVNLQGFLGVLAARQGDSAEAREISARLEGMADPYDFGRDVYWQACIASQLGELDRAMVLLREAYARGRAFSVILHSDMDLEPLRDHPQYQAFIRPKG